MPERSNWNGKTTTVIVGIMSALIGIIGGSVGAGAYLGSIDSKLETHIYNDETTQQTEARIRTIVDREINPVLSSMQRQLNRIENKLDEHD